MTKKTLYIVVALLLVAIIGIMLALTFRNTQTADAPSSGYKYLQYKDGLYIGTEKTDFGNIKVEVNISGGNIKSIKLVEMPQKLLTDCPGLKDEAKLALDNMVKTQSIVQTDSEKDSAYGINKMTMAVRNALNQSLLGQ